MEIASPRVLVRQQRLDVRRLLRQLDGIPRSHFLDRPGPGGAVGNRQHFAGACAGALLAAMIATASVFGFFNDRSQIYWLIPIMGFSQLALFGGYAIYFPELFPTRLRSTGTSFCYNVGRFVAASGPAALGLLTRAYRDSPEPLRYAGVTMCAAFLIGMVALPFAPETRGQPLPEEERPAVH